MAWETIRDTLSTHHVMTVVPTDKGDALKIRKALEPAHNEIYPILGIPELLMKPIKTWVR